MSDKYQNKYRVPSARLQHWDYGSNAMYFVTICTRNRECYFGHVLDGKMILSHVGVIADVMWFEIKNHAKCVELGEFVVMPNHVHGIIIINGNGNGNGNGDVVETTHALSLQSPSPSPTQTIGRNRFQHQGKNTLSSIVGSYKSAVSKHAHRLGFEFEWQSRFHDHIIRNDESFLRISHYIANNPANWRDDKFCDVTGV